MMAELGNLRFAHDEGLIQLCCDPEYTNDGKKILSCGPDGAVRVWGENVEDDSPADFTVAENATAICCRGENFYVGKEDNKVQGYSVSDGQADLLISSFNGLVTSMDINLAGDKVLAGSCDFHIKYTSAGDNSYDLFAGHGAPILSVALLENEHHFASSSCDGTVRIWNMQKQTTIKTLAVLPTRSNDISPLRSVAKMSWNHVTGDLAVPVRGGVTVFMKDSDWIEEKKLIDKQAENAIFSVTAITKDNKYLAAGSVEGDIAVWELSSGCLVSRLKHPRKVHVCTMVWHPADAEQLVIGDTEGQIGPVTGIFKNWDKGEDSDVRILLDIGPEDGDDDVIGGQQKRTNRIVDDDDEFSRSSDIGALKARYDSVTEGTTAGAEDFGELGRNRTRARTPPPPAWQPVEPQRPFIPASTPESLEQRYMKWNGVGVIRQYNTEEENSIEVTFHDSSLHHTIHLDNGLTNYTMADLSAEALAMGAPSNQDTASRVHVNYFGAWDQNSRDWTVDLPSGEEIETLCLGEGWVAFSTDKRILRILTVTGVQRFLLSVPGPVVSVAGQGDLLAVAYHAGMGLSGREQSLACSVYRVKLGCSDLKRASRPVVQHLPLALSSRKGEDSVKLAWFGFSSSGSLCTVDSVGVIRLLNQSWNESWIEICDTKNHTSGVSDTIWVIGIQDNPTAQIRCIPCKGSKYPALLPRPAVTILPWHLPLCDQGTEKSQLEENLILADLRKRGLARGMSWIELETDAGMDDLVKTEVDSVMKLFHLAMKAERECRAMDVGSLMQNSHQVQILIKYASRLKKLGLAEKLSDMAREKKREEEAGEQVEDELEPEEETRRNPRQDWRDRVGESVQNESLRPEKVRLKMSGSRGKSRNTPSPAGNGSDEEREILEKRPPLNLSVLEEDRGSRLPACILPSSGVKRNPFKRRNDEKCEERLSVFDSLTSDSKLKKSSVENGPEVKQRKTSQQMKQGTLRFGAGKKTDKPEERSKLTDSRNNESLMSDFQGESASQTAEFNKFATERFRKLASTEKQEWKQKAQALIDQLSQESNDAALLTLSSTGLTSMDTTGDSVGAGTKEPAKTAKEMLESFACDDN